MKILQGYPINISSPLIGKVITNKYLLRNRKESIYVAEKLGRGLWGFKGIITSQDQKESTSIMKRKPAIINLSEKDIHLLKENDIIIIETSGKIKIAWESNSLHNSIFITNFCNCH